METLPPFPLKQGCSIYHERLFFQHPPLFFLWNYYILSIGFHQLNMLQLFFSDLNHVIVMHYPNEKFLLDTIVLIIWSNISVSNFNWLFQGRFLVNWTMNIMNLQIMNWKIRPRNMIISSKLTELITLITTMSRSKNCSNSIGLRNPHSFLSAPLFTFL